MPLRNLTRDFDASLDHYVLFGAERLAAASPLGMPVARVRICSTTAVFNAATAPDRPDRLPMLMRQYRTRSFAHCGSIVIDFADDCPAFIGVPKGRNFGKTHVHLA